MVGVVGVVVGIAVQVVGKEADGLLQGDDIAAVGEHLQLGFGQRAPRALDEAAGVGLEHLGEEVDLIEVGLVLGGGGGTRADGVAEVIERGAGHDGVQVDDADGLLGHLVQQDVGELGIVVGHAEGEVAARQGIHDEGALVGAVGDESDLFADGIHPSGGVPLHGGEEVGVSLLGVVEIGDGLDEFGCVKVRESSLEVTEGLAHAGKGLGAVHRKAADGALHEVVGAPEAALIVGVAVGSFLGEDNPHGSPLGILARLGQTLADMVGDRDDVVHDPDGVLEDGGVEDLEDVAFAALGGDDVGAVDVAVAADLQVGDGSPEGEAVTDGQNLLMGRFCHGSAPQVLGVLARVDERLDGIDDPGLILLVGHAVPLALGGVNLDVHLTGLDEGVDGGGEQALGLTGIGGVVEVLHKDVEVGVQHTDGLGTQTPAVHGDYGLTVQEDHIALGVGILGVLTQLLDLVGLHQIKEHTVLIHLADTAGAAALVGEGLVDLEANGTAMANAVAAELALFQLGEVGGQLLVGVAAVEIVGVDDAVRFLDDLTGGADGVGGAPGLDTALGNGVALGDVGELLVGVLHGDVLLHTGADRGFEVFSDGFLDDEDHLVKARALGVEDRIVDDEVAVLVNGLHLLDTAEAGAHTCGQNYESHGKYLRKVLCGIPKSGILFQYIIIL